MGKHASSTNSSSTRQCRFGFGPPLKLPVSRRSCLRFAAAGAGIGASGLLATLSGCSTLLAPSPIPLQQMFDDNACPGVQAPVLLVMLPGAYMEPAEMLREGMVSALRRRAVAADVRVVDAHLGYLYDGSMLDRLHQDVVIPARAQGYRRIWFAGISLGGFLAMVYAMRHPGQVEGIVTLAPYLGRRQLLQAVAAAGGLAAWQKTAQPRTEDDVDHALWMWLSARPLGAPGAPDLYLGYGTEDRFAQGHALMAQTLPAGHTQTVPGGHDWPPWKQLWADWLDRGLLSGQCQAR